MEGGQEQPGANAPAEGQDQTQSVIQQQNNQAAYDAEQKRLADVKKRRKE